LISNSVSISRNDQACELDRYPQKKPWDQSFVEPKPNKLTEAKQLDKRDKQEPPKIISKDEPTKPPNVTTHQETEVPTCNYILILSGLKSGLINPPTTKLCIWFALRVDP
jgi:hypothetical protein